MLRLIILIFCVTLVIDGQPAYTYRSCDTYNTETSCNDRCICVWIPRSNSSEESTTGRCIDEDKKHKNPYSSKCNDNMNIVLYIIISIIGCVCVSSICYIIHYFVSHTKISPDHEAYITLV